MRSRVGPALVIAGLLSGVVATSVSAASALSWSRPVPVKRVPIAALRSWGGTSCPPRACASWSFGGMPLGSGISDVSCASASLCVAVDASGSVFTSTDPPGARRRGIALAAAAAASGAGST